MEGMAKITMFLGEEFQERMFLQLLKKQAQKAKEAYKTKNVTFVVELDCNENPTYSIVPSELFGRSAQGMSIKELLQDIERINS